MPEPSPSPSPRGAELLSKTLALSTKHHSGHIPRNSATRGPSHAGPSAGAPRLPSRGGQTSATDSSTADTDTEKMGGFAKYNKGRAFLSAK